MNRRPLLVPVAAAGVPHARGDEPIDPPLGDAALAAFPTPVGMNRFYQNQNTRLASVPHVRGDEPGGVIQPGARGTAFPTPVGMNRHYCN